MHFFGEVVSVQAEFEISPQNPDGFIEEKNIVIVVNFMSHTHRIGRFQSYLTLIFVCDRFLLPLYPPVGRI